MPEKRTALVTGGSSGIGAAIVARLLAEGMGVVSLDRQPPAVTHPNLRAIEVDLLDPAATAAAAREAAAANAFTHLIHNAGIIRPALLPEVDLADLGALTQLHLGAAITLAQAALPAMERAGFGRIVLVSSRAVLGAPTRTYRLFRDKGGPDRTGADLGAGARAQRHHGQCGGAGPTRSAMFHDVLPEGDPRIAQLAASIPVGRIGDPEDVAHAVMYFASEGASFVTGQTLYVCGGLSVGSLLV